MKNLRETTKKIKELSNLTKEDDALLLKRVGSHLLRKIDSINNQKKENNYSAFNGLNVCSFLQGGLPPCKRVRKITIIEVEVG